MSDELADELAPEEALALEQKAQEEARQAQLRGMRALMLTEHGRAAVWRLLGFCEVFHDQGPQTGEVANYQAGRRSVGLFLLAELGQADRALYQLMEREAGGTK